MQMTISFFAFFSAKIMAGIGNTRILDDIRDDFAGGSVQRIHLLTNQDINNIKKNYNLTESSLSDKQSVELWVESQKNNDSINPILLFKQQGVIDINGIFGDDDFFLAIMTNIQKEILNKFGQFSICIDSTHGTNNSKFHLTTILIVDEFGTGVPVAFFISNRVDTQMLEFFFSSVSKKVGIIKTRGLITDDVVTFVNAWSTIMGPPTNHYLCMWHVDRAIRNQLPKIDSQTKKSLVYKTFKILMEHNDKSTFSELMERFLEKCLNDKDTELFGKYFQTYYTNRPEKWACCFREGNLKTNNHLESFHRVLKYVYFDGRANKRIDVLIQILLKVIRNLCFDRLIKFKKGKATEKRRITLKRHNEGKLISPHNVKQVDDQNWNVTSGDNTYSVYTYDQHCSEDCQLLCIACNVCIHKLGCNCFDHTVRSNMCKHIHAVTLHIKKCGACENVTKSVFSDTSVIKSLVEVNKIRNQKVSQKNLMDEVINSTKILLSNLEINRANINKADASKLLNVINEANKISCLNKSSKKQMPCNEKLQRQEKYLSTVKRRRKFVLSLKRPTTSERKYLTESLYNTPKEIELISSEFDHFY